MSNIEKFLTESVIYCKRATIFWTFSFDPTIVRRNGRWVCAIYDGDETHFGDSLEEIHPKILKSWMTAPLDLRGAEWQWTMIWMVRYLLDPQSTIKRNPRRSWRLYGDEAYLIRWAEDALRQNRVLLDMRKRPANYSDVIHDSVKRTDKFLEILRKATAFTAAAHS